MKTKFMLISLMLIILTGCDLFRGGSSQTTGTIVSGERTYYLVCIDDVEYIKDPSAGRGYMSGHFYSDGSLHTCVSQ